MRKLVFILTFIFCIGFASAACVLESSAGKELDSAQSIDFSLCSNDLRISGFLPEEGAEVFKLRGNFEKGDILDVNVLQGDDKRVVGIFNEEGESLIINDHQNIYKNKKGPDTSLDLRESYSIIYVAISSTPGFKARGDYKVKISLNSGGNVGERPQKVLLDFNGASNVKIGTRSAINIPAIEDTFLSEEFPGRVQEIKNLITENVKKNFEGMDIEIYTTDNMPSDFSSGQYTIIYFGGVDYALLGVADSVDEYNSKKNSRAVIFVDSFSSFMRLNPTSEDIAMAISNVANHEIGHTLGLVHTRNPEEVMDVTASLRQMMNKQLLGASDLYELVFPVGKQNSFDLLKLILGDGKEESCSDGVCTPGEYCMADCANEMYCTDGVDNDANGEIDCNDSICITDNGCSLFVQIRVKDSSSGANIQGARVTFKTDGSVIATKISGSNGLTDPVRVGENKVLYIDVEKDGYGDITDENKGVISASTTLNALISLNSIQGNGTSQNETPQNNGTQTNVTKALIKIMVKDSGGAAISEAIVKFRVDGIVVGEETTGSNGLTEGVSIDIGKKLYVDAARSGYQTKINENKGTITSSTTINVILSKVIAETRPVDVTVHDSNSKAINGAKVEVRETSSTGTLKGTLTSDLNGITNSISLEEGKKYVFIAKHDSYATKTSPQITIPEGSGTYRAYGFRLGTTGGDTGTGSSADVQISVKSSTGQYISGATVKFKVDGNLIATKTTDSTGLTSIVKIPIGKRLYIDVTKTGYLPITDSNRGLIDISGIRSAVMTPA